MQGVHEANMALAARDAFVQVCLMGHCPSGKPGVPSVEDARQVCRDSQPWPQHFAIFGLCAHALGHMPGGVSGAPPAQGSNAISIGVVAAHDHQG